MESLPQPEEETEHMDLECISGSVEPRFFSIANSSHLQPLTSLGTRFSILESNFPSVLIIDDHEMNLFAIQLQFQTEGYKKVETA